jgi:hypothetical protein
MIVDFAAGYSTVCFIDCGKLNLLIISLPWIKSVKQTLA